MTKLPKSVKTAEAVEILVVAQNTLRGAPVSIPSTTRSSASSTTESVPPSSPLYLWERGRG